MTDKFDDVAAAILDGTPIVWSDVDRDLQQGDHALLDQLKALATLSRVVRLPAETRAAHDRVWGHLRVFERIGRGASGDVYRARDPRLDRDVALKLLTVESTAAADLGTTVIEEGRLLARVRHPNVVTIYGAERIDGCVGLWMELINGRTLDEALDAGVRFKPDETIRIAVELCGAVAAVHDAGLLHRDIKAQNIMTSDDGRLVLMDFGTGRDLAAMVDGNVTGTPLYLAPEVLAGGAATVQSDVYSIGVVLYRLLTNSYPVRGADLAGLRQAHARRTENALFTEGVRIPRRLHRVLARALDPDVRRRYRSAHDLRVALAALDAPAWRRPPYVVAVAALTLGIGALAWSQFGTLLPWARTAAVTPASALTVAVMPFKNLSAEADSDSFVDGLTSEVIRNLATIDGLQVRSQTSSFLFKNRPRDLRAIADGLNVTFVIEADVLRVGNRLRINAQLVQAADDVPLWSEQFDRTVDDVFAIQDEISRAIVNRLRLSIGAGRRRYQTNLAAYEAYLRARVILDRAGTNNGRIAMRLFEQVIALDPGFAPAHAGLSDAYAAMSWQLTGLSNADGLEGMRPAAERALELDPQLGEAHAAMGIVLAREGNWVGSEASFERALALSSGAHGIAANYARATLVPTGQSGRAEALVRAAIAADPLSPVLLQELAWIQHRTGRHEEAVAAFRQVLAADPGFPFANQGLARALTLAGRPGEAIEVWLRKPASDGDWERWIAHAYVRAGRRADVARLVEAHRNEHPYRQALIYAALGDKDRTFDALAQAAALAPHRTTTLLGAPEMALLRGDARLASLRAQLNLP